MIAKSEDVEADASALLGETVMAGGGKGGGSRDFARGSVPNGENLHLISKCTTERALRPAPTLHVVAGRPTAACPPSEFGQLKKKVRG